MYIRRNKLSVLILLLLVVCLINIITNQMRMRMHKKESEIIIAHRPQLIACPVNQQPKNNQNTPSQKLTSSKPEVTQQSQVISGVTSEKRTKQHRKVPLSPELAKFGSVCHTPQCIALYESTMFNSTSARIPTIRHILWKSDKVSSYFAKQLKTWSSIHPNWTYVLWRDSDMEKFVAKHYTGVLSKFKSLSKNIMRIDMIRHMILHSFGGVYADLDYILVNPLDRFLKFPAVVTREVEAHAFVFFDMKTYPPPVLGSPAFMMSEPGHPFFQFSIYELCSREASQPLKFAGPLGLSQLMTHYSRDLSLSINADGLVVVPASNCFYSFPNNSMASTKSRYKGWILGTLRRQCKDALKQRNPPKQLIEYCKDVANLNPITDPNETVYAIHDHNKATSSYDPAGSKDFYENPVNIRTALPNIVMADTLYDRFVTPTEN